MAYNHLAQAGQLLPVILIRGGLGADVVHGRAEAAALAGAQGKHVLGNQTKARSGVHLLAGEHHLDRAAHPTGSIELGAHQFENTTIVA
ncbi:hypothetical protein OHA77_33065 [Streptosporangium sp. NBC_01639]|uniref:hypothetical protein n=1 Tax=Streptosporangium sp. NBC_01639 TaxID=2975948 RepID=UPI00386FE8B7|nr:hypothetical protein OHA77_33065 [Streptosporangium sp. NBC_01639]